MALMSDFDSLNGTGRGDYCADQVNINLSKKGRRLALPSSINILLNPHITGLYLFCKPSFFALGFLSFVIKERSTHINLVG
jgi:hypothetical protein